MKKKILSVLFLFVSLLSQAQTKINGITFQDNYTVGKEKLILNGGGTREKYWMDMYVGGLYLTEKNKDAEKIIAADASMVMRICIVSGLISSEKMTEAVEEGFKKSTDGHPEKYRTQIDKFKGAFSDEIKKADVFDIVYSGQKVSVYKAGKLKAEIEGLDFKKVLFAMWIGKNPVQESFRDELLGK